MKFTWKNVYILWGCFALLLGFSCAPTLISVSSPEVQSAENSYYTAEFEPLSEGINFFDRFRLKVVNKSQKDLEIDWNKTHYLYKGRDSGIFVFKGIQPKNIKNLSIPPDIIPSGHTFSIEISPLKLIAREPLSGKGPDAGKITFGLIPNGESGILLIIRQNGIPIKEKMAVKITEKTIQ